MSDEGGIDSGTEASGEGETPIEEGEAPPETEANESTSEVEAGGSPEDTPDAGETPPEALEGEAQEGSGEEIELTDESILKIGDQEHSFQEISEAIQLVGEARGRITEANSAIERSNSVLAAIKEKPADALHGIFTSIANGDREEGYRMTVKLAAQIINKHHKLQQMHPGERRALTLEQELAVRDQRIQQFEAKEALEQEKRWTAVVSEAIKTAGLPPRYFPNVAAKLHQASQQGRSLDVQLAIDAVKKDLKAERADLMKTADPDEIPPELAQKLAERRIEAAKKKRGISATSNGDLRPSDVSAASSDGPIVYDSAKFLETFARTK